MADLHMIMGLPSAGKTTYAEEHTNLPEDAYLIELSKYAENVAEGPRMGPDQWQRAYVDMLESIKADEDIIIDANNTQTSARREIMSVARDAGIDRFVLHILCTGPKRCMKRIKPKGPDQLSRVRKMLAHQTELFMASLPDIQQEDWDEILFVQDTQHAEEAS